MRNHLIATRPAGRFGRNRRPLPFPADYSGCVRARQAPPGNRPARCTVVAGMLESRSRHNRRLTHSDLRIPDCPVSQSLIGASKFDLDTPLLCIDLDRMENNIRQMAESCRSHGVQWRPHEKCHKTPAIALKEIAAGAIGVTCAKVSEAEVMAAGGVRDILIANMIVGERKWERVASLCRHADPIVTCDHFAQVEPLASICKRHGVAPRVIIEVNLGLDRVGTRPGRETLELAQAISRLPGLRFAGIMGYEGHLLRIADPAEDFRCQPAAEGGPGGSGPRQPRPAAGRGLRRQPRPDLSRQFFL